MVKSHKYNATSLPCDRSLVVTGSAYQTAPLEWVTSTGTCQDCKVSFVTSADEQRFWYEELRIPLSVIINRCQECRGRHRTHRRIIQALSLLLPLINTGMATPREQREAVLTIAEGMIKRLPTPRSLTIPILGGPTIAQRCATMIMSLRHLNSGNDDLIPLLIMTHEQLENPRRVERLRLEMETAKQRSKVMECAIRTMSSWLATPTKSLRDRITDTPRA